MLHKWNRLLSFLLAIALVTTTFGSDFATARAYAVEGIEIEPSSEGDGMADLSIAEEVTESTEEPAQEVTDVTEPAEPTQEVVEEPTADEETQEEITEEDTSEEEITEEPEEKEPEEKETVVEEKLVKITYKASKGGRVSTSSEEVDINKEDAAFQGSTATAWNDKYTFVDWTDKDGNQVSTDATFVPSDVTEDATFTANFLAAEDIETAMPSISADSVKAGDMIVSVSADAGLFPEGTEIVISAVDDDTALELAQEVKENATQAKAVDIKFVKDEQELQPADSKYVHVSLALDQTIEGDDFSVLHQHDGEVKEISADVDTHTEVVDGEETSVATAAEFKVNEFSIFIISNDGSTSEGDVDGQQHAVVTYEFYDGDTLINTQTVKAGDELVSPGIPYLGKTGDEKGSKEFDGWYTKKANGQFDQKVNFGPVSFVENANSTIKAYAKINTTYYVTFLGMGVNGDGTDREIVQVKKVTLNNSQSTIISVKDVSVTPKLATQAFDGWALSPNSKQTVETVDAATTDTVYAVVVNAHWITFDKHGSGATYTGKKYVKEGETATAPVEPSRAGYDFLGWYTEAEGGEEFTWGEELTDDITLYAHWEESSETKYTVIVWKQQVHDTVDSSDKHYDFGASMEFEGQTGATLSASDINTKVAEIVSGTANFSLDHFNKNESKSDKDVTINAKGDTVINVYYDRDTIAITFKLVSAGGYEQTNDSYDTTPEQYYPYYGQYNRLYYKSRGNNKGWYTNSNFNGSRYQGARYKKVDAGETVYDELVGLYEQNFSQVPGASWPYDYEWYTQYTVDGSTITYGGSHLTFLAAFLEDTTVYGYQPSYESYDEGYYEYFYKENTINHYRQQTDGTYRAGNPDDTTISHVLYRGYYYYYQWYEERVTKSSTFTFTDKYEGFDVDQYYVGDSYPNSESQWKFVSDLQPNSNGDRSVDYVGHNLYIRHKRNSGNITFVENFKGSTTEVGNGITGIPFEKDLAAYSGSKPEVDTTGKDGFTFVGWFKDKNGTELFQWNEEKMPANNLVLYGYWKPMEYKVHLDKGADDAQWVTPYNDPAFTLKYIAATDEFETVSQEDISSNVKRAKWELVGWFVQGTDKPYDFGQPTGDEEDIYLVARWRFPGVVRIIYEAGSEAASAPTDDFNYATNSYVVVAAPPTGVDDEHTFKGWIVDGGDGKVLLPNNSFQITGDMIQERTDKNGKKYNAVVLRASYETIGTEGTSTEKVLITFNANYGENPATQSFEWSRNEAHNALGADAFTRQGYELIGWSKMPGDNNGGTNKFCDPGQAIGVDSKDLPNTLYAIWKQKTATYTIEYYKGKVTDNTDNEGHFIAQEGPFTVKLDGVENLIQLSSDKLNAHKPAKGYKDGVQQDNVPFEVTENGNNVIKVLYTAEPVTVTISGATATKDYTGVEQSVAGYTVVSISGKGYTEDDFAFVGAEGVATVTEDGQLKPAAKGTNVGSYKMGLTRECFNNTNSAFTDVTFVIAEDGKLTINPVSVTVTITGNSDTKAYNGSEQSVSGYNVSISNSVYKEADFTFNGTDDDKTAKGTDVDTYTMALSAAMFENTNPNFAGKDAQGNDYVKFVVNPGTLTITPVSATVTIVGDSNSRTYDGEEHSVSGYTATTTEGLFDVKDIVFDPTVAGKDGSKPVMKDGEPSATRTDAGTTYMHLGEGQFSTNNKNFISADGTSLVTFVVTDGYQTISPLDGVVVTITGAKNGYNYDGTKKTVSGYTFEATDAKYKESDFIFDNDGDGQADSLADAAVVSGTNVGTYGMGLKAGQFKNNSSNFTNVTFNVTDGELVISPVAITVTIKGHKITHDYDGTEYTASGYDVEIGNPEDHPDLYKESDFSFSGTESVSRTDAGTTYMLLAESQFTNNNANFVDADGNSLVTFVIAEDGFVKIDPIAVTVTIKGETSELPYDGEAHTVNGFTAEASNTLYKTTGDDKYFSFNGTATATQTVVGKADMGLDSGDFENKNPNFDNVTFTIAQDGYQKINPIDITVKITGNTKTEDYNGQEHTVSGYTAEASSTLYDVTKDFTFKGNDSITETNAGTYNMELAPGQFENKNPNFGTVTFTIVKDGQLVITPIDVTVTIEGATSSVPYDGTAHTVNNYTASTQSALYDVTKDFKFSGTATASQTDVGKTMMGLAADQFENTNPNFGTVTFDVTDGYQEITPISATVYITGNNNTAKYDRTEHVIADYEVTSISTNLYSEADFTFTPAEGMDLENGKVAARRTEVGTTNMGLKPEQFTNNNPNFIKKNEDGSTESLVTFEVVDGYQAITAADEIVVTINGTKVSEDYNKGEHIAAGYTVAISDPSLYSEDDFTFTWTGVTDDNGKPAVKATNVGTYPMGLAISQFKNNNTNFQKVTFVVNDGELKINPISAVVTIVGNTNTKTYDGNTYEANGFKVTDISVGENLLSKSDILLKDSGAAHAEGTTVGKYPMGLTKDSFNALNSNFIDPETGKSTVTFEVTDGFVQINPANLTVTITGAKDSVDYNGEEQRISGYEVSIPDAFKNIYTEKDFTFNGTDIAKGTDADTYEMGLKPEQFTNTNANFKDADGNSLVTFAVTDGELEIKPINVEVTIKGTTSELPYDGKAHTVEGFTAVASNNLYITEGNDKYFTFNGTAEATQTDAGKADMGLESGDFVNANSNFKNVTFTIAQDGYQKINPIDVEVQITGNTKTEAYNGQEHTASGYTAKASSTLYDVTKDFTFKGNDSITETNAGIYNMKLASGQFENKNPNFGTVTFTIVKDGQLVITPIDVTVTIEGTKDSVTYDGKEHSVSGYSVKAISTPLYKTSDFTFNWTGEVDENGDPTVKGTAANTYPMGLAEEQFENTNKNFANVTFEVTDGELVISPVGEVIVTITGHNDTKTYDGTEHSVSGYDVSISNPLYTENHFTFSGDDSITETDAGTYYMGLDASQFTNNDTTNFPNVTFRIAEDGDGYLKINPASLTVTITGAKDSVDYNGEEQSITGYEVSIPDAFKEIYSEADFTFSGTKVAKGTNAGTYPMGLKAEQFENANKNFVDVTFAVTDGELEIKPIDVTVTITGESKEETYTGEEFMVKGFTAETESKLYNVDTDFTFTPAEGMDTVPVAKGTDVGTYNMGLAPEQFKNTNKNFKTVTFEVKDGVLKINPVSSAVIVNITGAKDSVDYDGQAHTVSGYTATTENSLYKVSGETVDFTFNGPDSITKINAGTYPMGLANNQFQNTNNNFSNVQFVVVEDGSLEIKKIDAIVKIVGDIAEGDYNGTEYKAKGYTATTEETLYDVNNDFTFAPGQVQTEDGKPVVKSSNVGTYPMGLASEQFENTNPNFGTVTFQVTDGYVKINPIFVTVTIEGNVAENDYNGQEHVVNGYEVKEISTTLYTEKDFKFVPAEGRDLENGQPAARRTENGTTYMNLSSAEFQNINPNFAGADEQGNAYVSFVVTDGRQSIGKISATVKITGDIVEEIYNGKKHTAKGFTAVPGTTLLKASDIVLKEEAKDKAKVELTEVGTLNMNLTGDDFECTNDNFENVVFEVTDGYVKVSPARVIVKVTGNHDSFKYDMNPHTVTGYKTSFEDDVEEDSNIIEDLFTTTGKDIYKEEYIKFTGKAEATRTVPGTTNMELTKDMFENTNKNFEVDFAVTDGYVEITKRGQGEEFVIKAVTVDTEKPYIGEDYTEFDFDLVPVSSESVLDNLLDGLANIFGAILVSADDGATEAKTVEFGDNSFEVTGLSVDLVARDVSTYPLKVTGTMHVEDEEGNNVSDQFTLDNESEVGTLTITPATLTVTTGGGSKQYDGSALRNSSASITGFVGTDVDEYANLVKVTATGSQTSVGSSTNTYSIEWGNAEVIKGNYKIAENLGTLTVNPVPSTPSDPTPIPDAPTPTAAAPAGVLGARREDALTDGAAVLGARRGRTEDEANTTARAFAIIMAAAAAITALIAGKKKEEEED